MHLLALHVGEHILDLACAGNKERRARDALHRRFGTRQQAAENVFGVDDADDVVE